MTTSGEDRAPKRAACAVPGAGLRPQTGVIVPPVSDPGDLSFLTALDRGYSVVIDTSVITGDVIKTVKGNLPSPLFLALSTGLMRAYMAHHTWAEVPRVLKKRAALEGVDPEAAERLWWTSYVAIIRFVSTSGLPPGDPALDQTLQARDPTDLPTLRLASLIAPAVVLAADADLQDIGLAYERWWEIPDIVRKIVAGQGSTELAATALFGAGHGIAAAIRGSARLLQRPPVAAGVLGVIALAVITRKAWYPVVKHRIGQASPQARQITGTVGRAVWQMLQQHLAAVGAWSSAQRGQPGQTLLHRVARLLATSPKAMTRTEIAAQLKTDVARRRHQAVMTDLSVILNGYQAFSEVSHGRWQLGKTNANLGGQAIPLRPVVTFPIQGQPHCTPTSPLPETAKIEMNATRASSSPDRYLVPRWPRSA
jgi:hypothetical protein